jgi:predicted ATPase with chaperone activity
MAAMACDHQAGKSLLARRLTTLPPAMTLAEARETTRIHRVAGLTGGCLLSRPSRANPRP